MEGLGLTGRMAFEPSAIWWEISHNEGRAPKV